MLIREAIDTDMPALLAMAREFFAASGYGAREGEFDPATTARNFNLLRMHGILLVADVDGAAVGMAGLVIGPGLCNQALKAHEVCWWIDPKFRGGRLGVKLYRAIEPAVRARGCIGYQMGRLKTSPAGTGALYERDGLTETEIVHTKIFAREGS